MPDVKNFLSRFVDYPLPVVFAGFYMYWMADMLTWVKTLGENIDKAEWVVSAVVAGAVAYFKLYVDLVLNSNSSK